MVQDVGVGTDQLAGLVGEHRLDDDRGGALGDILASSLSKVAVTLAWLSPRVTRPLRTMPVLIPPGCTQVTPTGWPASSMSWRTASVKPRTANFEALYVDEPATEISPKQTTGTNELATCSL